MKTTDVFFKDTNFVGREIENVQDLVKALAANMDIATEDACGYSTFYDKEVEDEDGNVTYVETEKTEEELFNEMKNDLDHGNTLFAGFFLDCRKFEINPAKTTTLQTNLYVGQKVYVMHNNKVTETIIEQLVLIKGNNSLPSANTLASDFASTFYEHCNSRYTNKPTHDYICQEIGRVKAPEHSSVCVKIDGRYQFVELSEVFATKEELVKHLMED